MTMSRKSNIKKWLYTFIKSPFAAFIVGALIGLIFFAWFYGLDVVNPTHADWIWHPITHDTAQHQLGWEFLRQDSDGLMINGLACPVGLSAVFMDVIPLLALIFKPFVAWLPSSFQYFGIWGLLCYLLMGGLGAVIVRRIWLMVMGKSDNRRLPWQYLAVAAGSLLFVLSPMVMARSFYHPALAGQWIILLGFIVIIDSLHFKHLFSLMSTWALIMILAVLIHPYFLPMMGVLMAISVVRYWPKLTGRSVYGRLAKAAAIILIPSALCLIVFGLNGGFTQGTGSEVHDLEEKGFNLLSFINPMGYSVIPAFPNRSSSPETMMWLGLGVWLMLITAAVLWFGHYKSSWFRFKQIWHRHTGQCVCALIACIGLAIFALGNRIDAGPITLLQYSVPDKIYEIWSAFRAAAREAWPFYYGLVCLAIYWLLNGIKLCLSAHETKATVVRRLPIVAAVAVCSVVLVQSLDILNSPNATARHSGFMDIRGQQADFKALDLGDVYSHQKHLVALDASFRGDQDGTYVIGRTALQYGMSLNTGFFARVPDEIEVQQSEWRDKLTNGEISDNDFVDYLFFTKDKYLADTLDTDYDVKQIDDYYFITR